MANFTFTLGQDNAVVGNFDSGFVFDLAAFNANDVVDGFAGDGTSSFLRFEIAGGFTLDLTGYPGITGFDYIYAKNVGAVTINVSQDFHQANSYNNILVVGLTETGSAIGGTIDASGVTDGFVDLYGADGDDTFISGAIARISVYAGDGDDTVIDSAQGSILYGNTGVDTIDYSGSVAGVSVRLFDGSASGGAAAFDTISGFENLTGSAYGDTLAGDGQANTLIGQDGGDLLDGQGGADTLEGGDGDDTYVVDDAGDTVTEGAGEGTDLVSSFLSAYTLTGFVENLTLAAGALSGTGNGLGNAMTGNAGANALSGGDGDDRLDGGAGADDMQGGDDDDLYVVDDDGDAVTELAGQGLDKVLASIDFTLVAHVEKLVLTGTAMEGTGNALANALFGNAEDNHLEGLQGADRLDGRAGADDLEGGAGNDTYIVDDLGDAITEADGQGLDTLYADIAGYALAEGASVETLIARVAGALDGNGLANRMRASDAGSALSGHGGDDRLQGGAGADSLAGGEGADVLIGGSGADSFVFSGLGDGADTIADFEAGTDRIALDPGLFGADIPSPGALDAALFQANATGRAVEADDRLIYNTRNGALWFDADGSGDGAAVLIARLTGMPGLAADSFVILA